MYPEEATKQDCLEDSRFYDRLCNEISYGHWRCLVNHKKYYIIDYVDIEDYIIEALWLGRNMSLKELFIFCVNVQNKTTKIKFTMLHSTEISAKKFYENMAFFADQKCLERFIQTRMGII